MKNQSILDKSDKWNRFRKKREEVINKFIKAKRQQLICSSFMILMTILKSMQCFKLKMDKTKHLRKVFLYSCFVSIKLYISWKMRFKKYGPTLHIIHQKKIKQSISLFSSSSYTICSLRAASKILFFLKLKKDKVTMIQKINKAVGHILHV